MNKTWSTDLGKVRVHKDVVRQIVLNTSQEIEGVLRIHYSLLDRFLKIFKPKSGIAIKVDISQEDTVRIRVPVILKYGTDIKEVSLNMQEKILKNLQETLGVLNFQIDIDVRGIERG